MVDGASDVVDQPGFPELLNQFEALIELIFVLEVVIQMFWF